MTLLYSFIRDVEVRMSNETPYSNDGNHDHEDLKATVRGILEERGMLKSDVGDAQKAIKLIANSRSRLLGFSWIALLSLLVVVAAGAVAWFSDLDNSLMNAYSPLLFTGLGAILGAALLASFGSILFFRADALKLTRIIESSAEFVELLASAFREEDWPSSESPN
jgi:hypothetical protein